MRLPAGCRGRTPSCSRGRGVEERVTADLDRPPHDGPATTEALIALLRRRIRLPRLVRSTPAASARSPATSSRRRPTAPGHWPRSASSTARATSASASTAAAGSTSTGSTPTRTACPPRSSSATTGADHDHGDDRRHRGRRPDLARGHRPRAAVPARRRAAGEHPGRPLDHLPPLHRRRGHAPRPVHAARHRRRARAGGDGDRAEHRAPQRGPRGVRLAGAGEPRVQRPGSLGAALEVAKKRTSSPPTRRSRRARRLPGPPGREGARAHGRHARRRRGEIISLGRTNPRGRAVRRDAVRAAHLPRANGVARRHGEVAARCGTDVADKAVDDVRSRTSPTACTSRRGSASRSGTCSTSTSGEDWLDRATDPATWAPVDDIPAKELWDVRTQQRAELIEYVRHRAVADRLGATSPRPTPRPRRRSTRTC